MFFQHIGIGFIWLSRRHEKAPFCTIFFVKKLFLYFWSNQGHGLIDSVIKKTSAFSQQTPCQKTWRNGYRANFPRVSAFLFCFQLRNDINFPDFLVFFRVDGKLNLQRRSLTSSPQCTVGQKTMKSTHRVLGHSLVRSLVHSNRSLIRSLHISRFDRALRCAHSFAR